MKLVWRGGPPAGHQKYPSRWSGRSGVCGLLGLATILAISAGCSDTPYKIVPVSGKVTYTDGSLIPAEIVRLWFHPQADSLKPNVHARPGITELNSEDGTFAYVNTSKHADGVILGKHKVTVIVGNESATGAGSIPEIYADPATTPLEIEVTGKNQEFELKIDKPN